MTLKEGCNDFMSLLGSSLERVKRVVLREPVPRVATNGLPELIQAVVNDPQNPDLHLEMAHHYIRRGEYVRAVAALRTSLTLGGVASLIHPLLLEAYTSIGCRFLVVDMARRGLIAGDVSRPLQQEPITSSCLLDLAPTIYQRNKALATKISEVDTEASVLDAGGGDGYLALFLPHTSYMLAEPRVNGLRADVATFQEKSFDFVVSCHVLEHIPDAKKENFLDQLCRIARKRVILLGPFEVNPYDSEISAFIYKMTQAPWALEHVECGLMTHDNMRRFAKSREICCEITPNGNQASVFWMVFASYFAQLAGELQKLKAAEQFSNQHFNDTITNSNQPNDYLVEFILEDVA